MKGSAANVTKAVPDTAYSCTAILGICGWHLCQIEGILMHSNFRVYEEDSPMYLVS
jgi:hypothetical protein